MRESRPVHADVDERASGRVGCTPSGMTRIGHLMTPDPTTVRPTTSLAGAARLMAERGLRHLPVVDDGGRLVGMISDRDLRGPPAGTTSSPAPSPVTDVASVMTRDVIVASAADDLGAVARLIVDRRIGAVPVVDEGGGVLGIVSYVDVLRRLADEADDDARAIERLE
jgi:acetoin utilization protein AcuB